MKIDIVNSNSSDHQYRNNRQCNDGRFTQDTWIFYQRNCEWASQ